MTSLFVNAKSFTVCIACCSFAEILGMAYFKSVLTSIERRFALSSTTTALLSSSFQIGSMSVMVLISYFGSRYHRPRTLAMGCLLISLGFTLTMLPQFIGDRYEFIDISSNSSSTKENPKTCSTFSNTSHEAENCQGNASQTIASDLYLFIFVGIMLCGIGASPFQPLGYSYIDDHANKHNAAMYLGIINSISMFAPPLSFVLGSFTLRKWVDIGWIDTGEISIKPSHPGWVGAWWIGFIIPTVLLGVSSIPLWFFPKEMERESEKERKDEDEKKKHDGFEHRVSASLKAEAGGFMRAFKRLFTNKRYLTLTLLWTCFAFKGAGMVVFGMKYIQTVFQKSASASSLLVGTTNLPFLVLGTILGSYIIKRWKLEELGISRISLISSAGSILLFSPLLFIGCDVSEVAGFGIPYPLIQSSSVLEPRTCNSNCNCNQNVYTPVCGPNNISFISPCDAGCSDFTVDRSGKIKSYTSCSCIDDHGSAGNNSVTLGRCKISDCHAPLTLAIAFKAISLLFAGLHFTPMLILVMRSLKKEDKAFGVGMSFLTFRVLAFIPAPIVFGYLIDRACLFWSKKPCSNQSYCGVYDIVQYRFNFIGLAISIDAVCFLIALAYYFKFAVPTAKALKIEVKDKEKSVYGDGKLSLLLADKTSKPLDLHDVKESIL